MKLTNDIYIVLHTVMQLVFPICSSLIQNTVSQTFTLYAHCHVISASEIRHWSIQQSTDVHIVMHTILRLVLLICSTLFHKTIYRHSHCHAHCLVISESGIQHWSVKLCTDVIIVMHIVMWLVIPNLATDSHNCLSTLSLSCTLSCD
jgi:hypothetical protein